MNAAAYPRMLGLLTLGYGAYTLTKPRSLVHAAGLEPRDQPLSRSGRTLGMAIGARDVLCGAAMVLARPGGPLQSAVIARVACDLSDVIGFGLAVRPEARPKVVAIAGGWGALCATALPAAKGRR